MKNKNKSIIDGVKLPNKLCCTICNSCKGVRADVLMARMDKFEGTTQERLDALQKVYVCRSCRKEKGVDGTGTAVHTTSGGKVITDAFWNKSGYQFPVDIKPRSLTIDEIQKTTLHTCLVPNLFIDKNCVTCPYFNTCTFPKKRLKAVRNYEKKKRRGI
jgi:hypothetical protein